MAIRETLLKDVMLMLISERNKKGGVMGRRAKRMRRARPFVFANVRAGQGVAEIAGFIAATGGLAPSAARLRQRRRPADRTV